MRNIGKSIAIMTFAALTLPAAAQGVRVDVPLPGLEIRIGHTAPPQPRSEHKPHRPGADYTWAKGSWDWQGNEWAWLPGRWDRPTHHGAHWVSARYAREGSAWRYEPAHWSNQRVVEGDEYRHWKNEGHKDRDKNHDGHDQDHHHDQDHDRDGNHR